jgi:hypothetical protein
MAREDGSEAEARDATGAPESDRFERRERLTPSRGRGPSGTLVAIAGVVVIAVALVKPWASPAPVTPPMEGRALPSAAGVALVTATPVPTATPLSAESAARGLCFGIPEWRIVAAEIWADRPVRAWIAADGRIAHDPLDPNIAFTPVVATAVPSLGFCAPVGGGDRPPDDAAVALWRLDPAGATALRPRVREPTVPTPFGRLWWPVVDGGADPATWPAGRYVVGIAGGSGYARFLGIEVVLAPLR